MARRYTGKVIRALDGPFGYVYLTIDWSNGYAYVGQHLGSFNPLYLGSGTRVTASVKKHGRKSFTVSALEFCATQPELNQAEADHISILRSYGAKLYNIAPGGDCRGVFPRGFSRGPHSESHRKKIADASSKHRHTPETIAKISALVKARGWSGPNHPSWGMKRSLETRAKISRSKKGVKLPPHTEEAKRKMSLGHMGIRHTPEVIERINKTKRRNECVALGAPVI